LCFEYQLDTFASKTDAFEHELDMTADAPPAEVLPPPDPGTDPEKVLYGAFDPHYDQRKERRPSFKKVSVQMKNGHHSNNDGLVVGLSQTHGYPHSMVHKSCKVKKQASIAAPILQRIMVGYNKTKEQAQTMADYYDFWSTWAEKRKEEEKAEKKSLLSKISVERRAEPVKEISEFKQRLSSLLGKLCSWVV
jgi:hypothetical protein